MEGWRQAAQTLSSSVVAAGRADAVEKREGTATFLVRMRQLYSTAAACAGLSASQAFALLWPVNFVAAPYLSPRARELRAQQENLGRIEDPK
jgi:hypothetical protein